MGYHIYRKSFIFDGTKSEHTLYCFVLSVGQRIALCTDWWASVKIMVINTLLLKCSAEGATNLLHVNLL